MQHIFTNASSVNSGNTEEFYKGSVSKVEMPQKVIQAVQMTKFFSAIHYTNVNCGVYSWCLMHRVLVVCARCFG